jgi:aspartyl-tRNA(Asn)/glutamyl-tRNA(Gln) amidotransferase subunit C
MIKPSDIDKLAELARLAIPEDEKKSLATDLDKILAYVGKVEEIGTDTAGANPALVNTVMREDSEPHATGLHTETLLAEAPQRDGDYVKVKKILQ